MSIARIEPAKPLKPRPNIARARRRAPRHPIAPEKRLRKAVRKLFTDYHGHLVNILLALARRRRRIQLDDGTEGLDGALKSAAAYGAFVFAHSTYKTEVGASAADTAASAKKQTAKAIKRPVTTDLSKQEDRFAGWVNDKSQEKMAESIDRARDIYDAWDELDEDDEDYDDEDALEERLDEGLDGLAGAAIAYASLAFGGAFGDMIKESQTDSGVSTYTWLSQLDSHVRPSHEALEGEECSWDDPPLQPGEEPTGDPAIDEPAHPGTSPNCRCVSSPGEVDSDE